MVPESEHGRHDHCDSAVPDHCIGWSGRHRADGAALYAYAAINGGFFGGTASLSTVVYPNEVKSQNPTSLVRNGVTYPVTRSLFSITNRRQMRVNWIYHFGSRVQDIYTFAQPTPNVPGTPAPVPQQSNGSAYPNLLVGIGGAPTLVKGGIAECHVQSGSDVRFGRRA